MKVHWTTPAEADLDEVWTYIALDNIDAADRTADRLRLAVDRLSHYPAIGRRGTLTGTRELVVAGLPYVLIYRAIGQQIQILHVYHISRKWPPE
jgi:toxin ParE1/3/4